MNAHRHVRAGRFSPSFGALSSTRKGKPRQIRPVDWAPLSGMPPPPTFNAQALIWAHALVPGPGSFVDAALLGLRNPDELVDFAGMIQLFSLDRPGHCFQVAPHVWASFHEPQITGGFCHFISSGPPSQQIERGRAFVKAAFECAGRDGADLDALEITSVRARPELPVEGDGFRRRIDILVELHDAVGLRAGAMIEAKFGSGLRDGQLKAYRDHVRKETGSSFDAVAFLVVASTTGRLRDEPKLVREGWGEVSWPRFLLALERALRPDCDDDDFRRFRRTVWDMS